MVFLVSWTFQKFCCVACFGIFVFLGTRTSPYIYFVEIFHDAMQCRITRCYDWSNAKFLPIILASAMDIKRHVMSRDLQAYTY